MSQNKATSTKKKQRFQDLYWLKELSLFQDIDRIRAKTQQQLHELKTQPTVNMQLLDLKSNFDLMIERPLLRLQTQRLYKNLALDAIQYAVYLEQFKQIWENEVSITAETLKLLDPNKTQLKFANADTMRYQQFLLQALSYLLYLNQDTLQAPSYLTKFVEWLNGIEQAQTTAKVTLREAPNITSEIILELPKHTVLNVYSDPNPLWKKVRLLDKDQHFGFVMSAYLKF